MFRKKRKLSCLRDRIVFIDGEKRKLKSIGFLAFTLGVTTSAIKIWDKKGKILKPDLVDVLGRRWYCEEKIKKIVEAYEKKGEKNGCEREKKKR